MDFEDVLKLVELGHITLSPYEVNHVEKLASSENPLFGEKVKMTKDLVKELGSELADCMENDSIILSKIPPEKLLDLEQKGLVKLTKM